MVKPSGAGVEIQWFDTMACLFQSIGDHFDVASSINRESRTLQGALIGGEVKFRGVHSHSAHFQCLDRIFDEAQTVLERTDERAWRDDREAYAMFSAAQYQRLGPQLGLPMQVIASDPRRVIVRKP